MAAYLRTWMVVLACPGRAARTVVIPDRWGRALRWAILHVALCAAAAALLGNEQYFGRWILDHVRPSPFRHVAMPLWEPAPAGRALVWMTQSFMAWTMILASIIAIGCSIGALAPGRQSTAKWGGVKWSVYVAVVPLATLAVWYAFHFVRPPLGKAPWPFTRNFALPPPDVPVDLLAAAYGLWWSIGIAANPYNRTRGIRAVVAFGIAFVAIWLLFTRVLFPLGALEALL